MPDSRRWLFFYLRPGDLLHLFQILARDDKPQMHAAHFPPDTRIVEAFFDGERGAFVLLLESQFFDPVVVEAAPDGRLSGAWNQLFFDLNEVDDASEVPTDLWAEASPNDLPAEEAPPVASALSSEGEKRWCAFFIKPAQILWLLGVLAQGRPYQAQHTFPPDARLVFGTWDAERESFGLILSSEDFDRIGVETGEGGDTLRLALPERALSITVTDDGAPPPP